MTGNKIFLDTNIVIEVFAGNVEIADKIKELNGFFISSIVLGELYIGVNRVANRPKHYETIMSSQNSQTEMNKPLMIASSPLKNNLF